MGVSQRWVEQGVVLCSAFTAGAETELQVIVYSDHPKHPLKNSTPYQSLRFGTKLVVGALNRPIDNQRLQP